MLRIARAGARPGGCGGRVRANACTKARRCASWGAVPVRPGVTRPLAAPRSLRRWWCKPPLPPSRGASRLARA
eukprot:scaffold2090_cov225-Prasinococcus_capsulatus_cf.AAC.20